MEFADTEKTVFAGRGVDGKLYGLWTVRQWEGQEQVLQTSAEVVSFLTASQNSVTSRDRVSSATVFVDAVNGNDARDGKYPATAVKTLQRAFDYAHGNFEAAPPWMWVEQGNVGYRSNVTVQMAKAPSSNPYVLPQPAFLDGASPAGPITLRGDPANGLEYNIFAANSLQGLTSQNGAHLICDGFTIRGAPNCTLINTLALGKIAIKNVWFGGVAEGKCAPIGAAGGSQVDVVGPIHLIGAGFVSVFTAIEGGRIMLCPSHEIDINNQMDFGIMVNMMHAETWTQGTPPKFSGAGLSLSTGKRYVAYYGAYIGFSQSLIPGSPGDSDPTSYVAP